MNKELILNMIRNLINIQDQYKEFPISFWMLDVGFINIDNGEQLNGWIECLKILSQMED